MKIGGVMKNILRILFIIFLLTSLCFAQLYKQTKRINHTKTNNLTEQQDEYLRKFNRDKYGQLSDRFISSSFRNQFHLGIDKQKKNSAPFSFHNDRPLVNRSKGNHYPNLRILSSQTGIYVIDTAIIAQVDDGFIPADTSRHLYSYNANSKRITDLEQKLIGGYWIDTYRKNSLYDPSNNIVSEFEECWYNGQWVVISRYTYTYDAQGYLLTYLCESWDNDQLVIDSRETYTYDARGNMLMYLYERWANGQLGWSECFTFTYNVSNKMLTELYKYFDDGQWINSIRPALMHPRGFAAIPVR